MGGNELVAPHTSDAEPENIYDAGTFIYSAVVEPEPSTLVIFVLGIMGLGIFRIKNRK
ncbi:MAG: PEP-CTERM sorting domain-containing protein [Alteromonadaceae bacterium]|nr:PEP-CTERM sorting domain-containing protein [Alteromonadaceae bacterium]